MSNNIKIENAFSFLEPNGHFEKQSKIKRYWDKFNGPFSLNKKDFELFVYEGMTHSPLKYFLQQFDLNETLPTNDFIFSGLKNLIKTEFSNKELVDDSSYELSPEIKQTYQLSENEFQDFIRESEWPNRVVIPKVDENFPDQIAGAVYDILCNSKIGNYKNKLNNSKDEFIANLIPKITSKERLLFVLLGFPFKDQNQFRVPYDADNMDFAEISLMLRLFSLTQTIYQVHPYGVDIVVLTDGHIYKDIFGINNQKVDSYFQKLIHYRNKMNLQGAISFIPLDGLIERSSSTINIYEHLNHIESTISSYIDSDYKNISEQFDILLNGIKWNMNNSIPIFSDLDRDEILSIVKHPKGKVKKSLIDKWEQFDSLSKKSAIRYASLNILIKYHDLINKYFPNSIRSTVHPKNGQFGLTSSQNSFPWNGVAFSKNWPTNADNIRSVPFSSLNNEDNLIEVTYPNSKETCFYTTTPRNKNIIIAREILNATHWEFKDLTGRELNLNDLNVFIKAGRRDSIYTWERIEQGEEYFNGLLQFRLSHYKKYGFGVHGIWLNGELIGQFGLQVLNEEEDMVEVVLFLKKDYRQKGYGKELFKFLLAECKKHGIKELFGVVKPENKGALSLLEKFNVVKIGLIKHFKEQGVLHKFKL